MAKETETKDTGVAKNDAYTGMLGISLFALIVGSVLLFMDYSQHSGDPKKQMPTLPQPAGKKEPPVVVDKKDDKDGKDMPEGK